MTTDQLVHKYGEETQNSVHYYRHSFWKPGENGVGWGEKVGDMIAAACDVILSTC